LVSDADYPLDAIRNGEQGITGFRLDVARDGRVTNCAVTSSSGSASLDAATCRIMSERARFKPALDRRGRPTTDWVSSRIRWILPPPEPEVTPGVGAGLSSYISDADYPPEAIRRREQGRVLFELDISPEGRVTDCRVLVSSGSAELDVATCRIMSERPRFAPARDAQGHAVRDTVRSAVRWQLPGG
jgi:TonB family protein